MLKPVKNTRVVRGKVAHTYGEVGKVLGASGRTVQRMIQDNRLKSTALEDVVDYIRRTEINNI